MGCRKNRFMVVVLNARELIDKLAFMVIVNNRYRSYDFVVSGPFLLYERITHQVTEGLRAIAPTALLGESQEAIEKVLFNRYAETGEVGRFRIGTHGAEST